MHIIHNRLRELASDYSDPICSFGCTNSWQLFVDAEHPASKHNAKAARGELGCDQLFIIWPVTNNLTTHFQDIYMLEEKLTTNKSLCPF